MARECLTLADVVARSKLNHRTIKELLAGRRQPRPQTLHRLANSLSVPVEELFQDPALLRHRLFDRHTNPMVEEVVQSSPQLFHGWTSAEFDELYSRFGTGGALTREDAVQVARAMNRRRDLLAKAALLLETSEAELFESMLELLYQRAVVTSAENHDLRNSADCLPTAGTQQIAKFGRRAK
jgi:transcriptional regulator with XRE-family HTH domain